MTFMFWKLVQRLKISTKGIIDLKVPDMIHNIIPPPQFFFFKPTLILIPKLCHICLTFVVKFDVHIPNNLEETNRNVAWKLENVVTTLNKTISSVRIIFSYYLQTRYTFAVCLFVCLFVCFSFWIRYLDGKWPYLQVLARLIFWKLLCQAPLTSTLHLK